VTQLIDSLNPEQRAAVTLPAQSALILAGAGSGKTRVLTSRIAYLLENRIASPAEILSVTFTNKAAKEMLTRLTSQIPFNTRAMWIGTFHGLCNRMLRAHHEAAGLPATFAILDQSDQLSTIKRIMKANQVSEEILPAREVQQFINRCKEAGTRSSQVKMLGRNGQEKLQIYAWYEALLQKEGSCDFAELLLRSYELLQRNEHIRRHYQSRFRFILVDEFQDTNELQYRWLKLLAGIGEPGMETPNAVFAVGDDDQSIYAFRGARVGNMTEFIRDFGIKDSIRLEQNYRSFGNILDAANHLIANNTERLGKNLWTQAGKGEPIRVYGAETDFDEAAFVVDAVKGYINDGEPLREIAILYRSNAQSRVLETELTRRGVAYKVYGGLRFYDRAEIKHAVSYLRLAENTADDSAFLRVVNFPARGIGVKTIDALVDIARTSGLSLYDATYHLPRAAALKLQPFIAIIDELREQKQHMELPELVDFAIEKSGLKAFYESDKNGEERLENLKELKSAAQSFMTQERYDEDGVDTISDSIMPLAAFLSNASLESGDNQAEAQEDAVQLMTVHASKGLEFDVVFITGLEDGLFPHDSALRDEKNGLSEERRLMYVAITRARKILYLTYAKSRMLHGQSRYNIKSSFFRELPEQTLKWLSAKDEGRGGDDDVFSDDFPRKSRGDYGSGSRGGRDYGSSYSSGGFRNHDSFRRDVEQSRRFHTNTPDWAKGLLETKEEKKQTARLRAKAEEASAGPYRKGVKISHQKFGVGTIVQTNGSGDMHEIVVRFDSGRTVTLLTRIASSKITIL
jgi:DNA helicase-2/ATP-dependent DNA helicase PcrA